MGRMDINERMDRVFDQRAANGGGMSDSDHNIMADLAHEACEGHCEDCGKCLGEGIDPVGLDRWADVAMIEHDGHVWCEDCSEVCEHETIDMVVQYGGGVPYAACRECGEAVDVEKIRMERYEGP